MIISMFKKRKSNNLDYYLYKAQKTLILNFFEHNVY
jgi:hypothetical protein